MLSRLSQFVAALVLGLAAVAAQAAPVVSGKVWLVDPGIAGDAVPSNVPLRAPDVTFFAPSSPLSFDSRLAPNGYNLGAFLASGGAFNITELTTGALLNSTNDHLYEFVGQVTVIDGQTFDILHDDGLTLIIGGVTVVSTPGPTAPVLTSATYNGPSGTFDFQLVYGECCGAPAALLVDLPLVSQVPEPATLLLVGASLLGLTTLRLRRSR